MVFIDPPHNVKIEGNVGGLGAIKHREFAMASGEMSREQFDDFLRSAFEAAITRLRGAWVQEPAPAAAASRTMPR